MQDQKKVLVATGRPLLALGIRTALAGDEGLTVVASIESALELPVSMSIHSPCAAVVDAALFADSGGLHVLEHLHDRHLTRFMVGVGPKRPDAWCHALIAHPTVPTLGETGCGRI